MSDDERDDLDRLEEMVELHEKMAKHGEADEWRAAQTRYYLVLQQHLAVMERRLKRLEDRVIGSASDGS